MRIGSHTFLYLFICLSLFHPSYAERLILHFDINETLIASDQAAGKSAKDTINRALAQKYKEKWSESIAEPISYQEYVYRYLLPGDKNNSQLKEKRLQKLFHFTDFIQASAYPIKNQVLAEYHHCLNKFVSGEPIQIFPSFFKMIRHLQNQRVSFTLQIRTFGKELPQIVQAINTQLGCEFIKYNARFENRHLFIENRPKPVISLPEIYQFFKICNVGVQDSWKEWSEHQKYAAYGKLFPIDLEDPHTIAIFFDDNIRPQEPKNIVNAIDIRSGCSVSARDLIETHNLVIVDMLQAIEDEDYFIKHVQQACAHSMKQKRLELLELVEF
ncbi:putative uncharacterized protein [Parachlamydia acanthamoebae UV-7]|jgi:hypothetical protein|uniref:Uncharacterized protein n=1 Tax=Parachlamydia acanthamoebae (strain UV7) TaxID=765952 RepID=F8KVT7_PARAV|nr:hypothetical protein [Parachlamydia acanthamoebae]EFB42155.1 hypothetical protein pah_c014o074 [Parachlamydia acanthamoebae str. Hall's coccus]CCB85225.1 putative uncharacterized protein [Parachlamydia acanthamoebae UV-7]